MPKNLKMPDTRQLPLGARRDFVEELFVLYRAAGRPALRDVTESLNEIEERAGTASHETIRRALKGISIPRQWSTVEAILLGFCSIAGIDPKSPRYRDQWGDPEDPPYVEVLKEFWNRAIDADEYVPFDENPPF